ncbi:MAG: hypothetical protein ACTHMC_06200 [Pseudobacter sp.]|uniref:hypothetical protein n=1 Tax=Pseudobacter sp. TaxID=2045420 RepID=UPI003F81369E
MSIFKKIAYAFVLCAGLTYIGLKFTWNDTSWFNIFILLHFVGFIFLIAFLLIFSKLFKMGMLKSYLLATICGYIAYMVSISYINHQTVSGGTIAHIHASRDFVPSLLSFLLGNTAILIYTYFEERSKKTS